MKQMSNNEMMSVNGGYYYCKLCGYKNDSYWNVYSHCLFKEVIPTVANILKIISFF